MADNNDDSLSVNSDFERIPDTPMERVEEEDDLDLDEGQKTPKGFVASEFGDQQSKNDPVVDALMKKVDILAVKVDGLSTENAELRTHFVHFKHNKEHEDAEFVLVDNSKGAFWDTSTSQLIVQAFTVKNENGGVSIRSTRAFSTVPSFADSLIYNVNNYEVTIEEMSSGWFIHVGFAIDDFPMDHWVGESHHSFAITNDGTLWLLGEDIPDFAPGKLSVGDTVGCAIMVGSKTATAEAVDCKRCLEKPSWLLFTKNGRIWGNPVPFPSNLPSTTVFPTISLSVGCKVTANFGHKPFKYVPSATDFIYLSGALFHCGQLNNELEKMLVQQESDRNNVEANTILADLRAKMSEQQVDFQSKLDAVESKANNGFADLHAQMAKQQADFQMKMAKQQAAFELKIAEQQTAKLDAVQRKHNDKLDDGRKEVSTLALATHHGQLGMLKDLKPKFVEMILVNNTEKAAWNLVENEFSVSGNSVTKNESHSYRSIRSKRGFSTEKPSPIFGISDPSKVHLLFHYFEITIDRAQSDIFIGLALEDFPADDYVGSWANSFAIDNCGTHLQAGAEKYDLGPAGFTQGDTIGCGLMVVQHEGTQTSRWIFFTKNGNIWGTLVALPLDVPSVLYPTVTIYEAGDKVTANFGNEPFKYGIPPAEGLLC